MYLNKALFLWGGGIGGVLLDSHKKLSAYLHNVGTENIIESLETQILPPTSQGSQK